MSQAKPVLRVVDLQVSYYTEAGRALALDRASLELYPGEKLGMVGESGCGKSTMALAMMRMIKPPGRIEGGQVFIDDIDLMTLPEAKMRKARLSLISYIPQGAMNSLNPVLRIEAQMRDAIKEHLPTMRDAEVQARIYEALESVELRREVARMYPHELSGGMKQRVCIAIGILLGPKVIIADEPTSALDVVTQRQVMETLDRNQKQLCAAMILIGHDMGLMAQFVDKVAVMYAGKFTEISPVRDIFTNPLHPYARALIESLPTLNNKGVFKGIPGLAPSLINRPPGCTFHPRCPEAMEICKSVPPALIHRWDGRQVACYLYDHDGRRADEPAAVSAR